MSAFYELLLGGLCLALVLTCVRLLRGPTLPDRVVALDLATSIAVAFVLLFAIAFELPVLLDVALALALISFVGTVAFATYVERTGRRP
ncbi:monovalent cation/H+ antiporter complex subunit F [Haliangium ochraceum]|uniref:Multiple resistance and pH regulation protein F n=1 Tax=Haliangium ochraceum (strain DSM 14365 / JCM 11303 / SMP-2) TaxID=502025 RepID=D0LWA6_HALO1|nr:monovalent cation/H+ antiporter complex subunit F [Haliangium ochraceum]ACY16038.1 multiple resistance and pH regulation protein F [Haliangium ochraceum DSM 14365]